ncbi:MULTISPECIES: D-alanine--D-alanine ligase [Thiomicrorhabdus]|uniref:D-alanine--D-alanine ligase n=1 Tax=Thiomicrorhabdus heinhorstiae TaxID=2748010 RepID=A0ABS0BXT4_9GAMM|nr:MULTISPECIES: D-alanine--D-alanine ligase [Thiomicrorhabdus]MBF6058579.1 D-alanine--D-alanine ligase [Thiomicrorhabdus heinhorstiae]
MPFGKVAVLMGGKAAEREISLRSGKAVTEALQAQGIDAHGLDVKSIDDLQEVAKEYDRAFIALHGRWGEDGVVQAVLEDLDVPFTGSPMAPSAIAMDKLRTKWMWLGAGLPTPKFVRVSEKMPLDLTAFDLDFPVIVKPCHEGSSIGMRKVYNLQELQEAVEYAQQFDHEILIEQWITGKEYTGGVLNGEALPLIRLQTPRDFYDYEAKYRSNDTQYICPCGLDEEVESALQTLVLQAFDVIGSKGWGRVDLMVDEQGQPWLIELNSVPGMTDHSLVPMAARAKGISFEELVHEILAATLEKKDG